MAAAGLEPTQAEPPPQPDSCANGPPPARPLNIQSCGHCPPRPAAPLAGAAPVTKPSSDMDISRTTAPHWEHHLMRRHGQGDGSVRIPPGYRGKLPAARARRLVAVPSPPTWAPRPGPRHTFSSRQKEALPVIERRCMAMRLRAYMQRPFTHYFRHECELAIARTRSDRPSGGARPDAGIDWATAQMGVARAPSQHRRGGRLRRRLSRMVCLMAGSPRAVSVIREEGAQVGQRRHAGNWPGSGRRRRQRCGACAV